MMTMFSSMDAIRQSEIRIQTPAQNRFDYMGSRLKSNFESGMSPDSSSTEDPPDRPVAKPIYHERDQDIKSLTAMLIFVLLIVLLVFAGWCLYFLWSELNAMGIQNALNSLAGFRIPMV